MTDRVRIGTTEDVPPGERTFVDIDGKEVSVINHDGDYYALLNWCPHQGGPVGEGIIRGRTVADWPAPGKLTEEDLDDDSPTITCPWHGWEYDLATCEHVGDDVAVPSFEVVVEDGVIYVED